MLSIKSIASKLGFGTGVAEQVAVVTAKSIKDVASKTYKEVSSHEYSKDYKEFKQEFNNGRVSGKEFVDNKLSHSEKLELIVNEKVELITL